VEQQDRIISLIWIAIGGVLCFEAWSLGLGKISEPQTGFMPFVVGLAIIVLSAFLLIESSVAIKKGRAKKVSVWSNVNWKRIAYMVFLLMAYSLLLNKLGFLVDTFLLTSLLIKSGEGSRWPVAVIGGLLISGVSFVVFRIWLLVPFPEGILGF
jgi:putative tricarboxylic transport membrane protein